jgi:hypothetical protein
MAPATIGMRRCGRAGDGPQSAFTCREFYSPFVRMFYRPLYTPPNHGTIRIVKRIVDSGSLVANFVAAVFDSLWILGLAGMLAVLGFVEWERSRASIPFRTLIFSPAVMFPLSGCLFVVILAVFIQALTSTPPSPVWQVVLLGALSALSLTSTISAWRAHTSGRAGHAI